MVYLHNNINAKDSPGSQISLLADQKRNSAKLLWGGWLFQWGVKRQAAPLHAFDIWFYKMEKLKPDLQKTTS